MKIKGPTIPHVPAPPAKGTASEIKTKAEVIASELAGLVAGDEDVKKKERKKALSRLSEAEKRKRLKTLGAKCGVKQGDSAAQATQKIVHGILSDHYDSDERGFDKMVDEICGFILADGELEALFGRSVKVMQSEEV